MELKKFKKVLVANRGEIAIRVFRALNELGITTVGFFSKEDRYALFRSKADESYQLNPDKGPIDAYLDINTIIRIAKEKNVDAIHPGYGFLSENPDFVDACEKNGITFIGPSSSLMRKMGDKISSKQMAIEADVPIIPGVDHAVHGLEEVTKIANQVGYPVMLKASNGTLLISHVIINHHGISGKIRILFIEYFQYLFCMLMTFCKNNGFAKLISVVNM